MTAPDSTNPARHSESLLVHFRRAEEIKRASLAYPSIQLDERRVCELESLLCRAFYPLDGYLGREDYASVLATMRLADGALWPMPTALDVTEAEVRDLAPGMAVALRDPEGFMLAVLHLSDIWRPDRRQEALAVFGAGDPEAHPGVRDYLAAMGPVALGGRLEGLQPPTYHDFPELRLTPSETTRAFALRGWRRVLGVPARDVLHRAEREAIAAAAREAGANIFLQTTIAPTSLGRTDHFPMVRCHQALTRHFSRNVALPALTARVFRAAGPRQALLDAITLKNHGCSHVLLAPDHADPLAGDGRGERFYPLGSALALVAEHAAELGLTAMPLREMAYVEKRGGFMAVAELAPGEEPARLPPEELTRRLEYGLDIPEWFSFPEVARELRASHPPRHKQGLTLFLTGLSGAGKSTLAKILLARLSEINTRPVTLLDGDIVRKNLSSELTFSRQHRDLNIRRIGFVSSEITKNGGIAICAPIAPYAATRRAVREMIAPWGGFIEVYMSTPLDVCEQRDRKGIYAKARAGIMKGVTGIDDPYEPPERPDITIDTTGILPNEAAQEVLLYLEEAGYLA